MTNWCVGVIDDHQLCRDAIVILLKTLGIAAEAFETAEDMLAARPIEQWDCVFIDLRLEASSGWQVALWLRSLRCNLPLIILTAHSDDGVAKRVSIDRPAIQTLLKSASAEELVAAISLAVKE